MCFLTTTVSNKVHFTNNVKNGLFTTWVVQLTSIKESSVCTVDTVGHVSILILTSEASSTSGLELFAELSELAFRVID